MPREDGQFKTGNPGRPRGSRNKLTKKYLDKLWADFKEHGESVLERVRRDNPVAYLKLVASLVPRDIDLHHSGDMQIKLVSFLDVEVDDLKTRQETFETDATPKKLDS
jgi:hypothetical protein